MRVEQAFLGFFRTRPDQPLLADAERMRRLYEWKRQSVFFSLLIGYSFFYVARLVFSVTKKVMIDDGFLNADQMGRIGSAFFFTYAIGKLVNGFLADRSNISRFMATGLLCSAAIVVFLGFNSYYLVFLALWGIHGWVQSMGAAPSGASLSQWFSNRERGVRYGLWSAAHSIGEGLSFTLTATIVAYLGWRCGFWGAGGVSLIVALIMYKTLADRPQTYGLPAIADYKNDHVAAPEASGMSVGRAQIEVLKNPYVWILGFACTAMYIARYGMNSWGVLYLQEAKGYPLIAAGMILTCAKIAETAGTIASGFISDKLFHANRNVASLLYGVCMVVGLGIFWQAPSTRVCDLGVETAQYLAPGAPTAELRAAFAERGVTLADDAQLTPGPGDMPSAWRIRQSAFGIEMDWYWLSISENRIQITKWYDMVQLGAACLFGFGIGGLLAFLGGLIAIDICSKKAAGAAMGVVGMFSYLGASIQERVSGGLLESSKIVTEGQISHDFTHAIAFWFGAACVSVALSCLVWRARPTD